MNWQTINITINPEDLDTFLDRLIANDITQYTVIDPREIEDYVETSVYSYDYIEENVTSKKDASITVYLPSNDQGKAMLKVIFNCVTEATRNGVFVRADISNIKEEDWQNSWKQYYKPINVGKNLIIKPTWEVLPEDNTRTVVEMDPSSSFGTGTHETTRLCMENIEKEIHNGDFCLDMGAGSGILAVTEILLGAKKVITCDVEEDSIRVTKNNMALNKISEDRFETRLGNILSDEELYNELVSEKYDLISANIVADIIIAMSEFFDKSLKENGVLIVSGIILDRVQDIYDCFDKLNYTVKETNIEGEWAAITLTR